MCFVFSILFYINIFSCGKTIYVIIVLGKKSNLRKTNKKIAPSNETINKLKQSTIWKMENEFYEFVLDQFHFIKEKSLNQHNGKISPKKQQFRYEKIKPEKKPR